ncbi:cystathionine beta-lyase [Rhizocola hellebori]|uniref:cysteine-S-conjugate beta-lyase n=1 Tax=Rhizocola hellebori TaxID=1392758 RepID=A0A8J3QFS5_9ACTN|nr:cystathionine beta-lyase [Rhizocola hellebori]
MLPLWVAEMDVRLAPPIASALIDAVERSDTGYPMGTEYAEALDEFARKRWGWEGVVAQRTMVVPDVMQGTAEILKIVTGIGDQVIVNSPVYPPFYAFVEHMGRGIVEAPLGEDHRLDLAGIQAAFEAATAHGRRAAYLLCSPHNPTGTVHTADELAAVAALARAYRVRVIADEIHAPLVLPGAVHVPYLSVPGAENGFSMMSASKAWNLAGLKAAVAVAGPDAAEDLARIPEEVSHGPSHFGVLSHTAALRGGVDWLDSLLAALDDNRRLLGELIAEHLPAVRLRPPQATFLSWLDCRALGIPEGSIAPADRGNVLLSSGPADVFLERGRVALVAGLLFGTGGAGHVRLNYATSPEVITEAVRRMAAALSD